jgi:TrmH family RNA methyltransferase
VFAAALREDAYALGELELRRGDCFVIGNEGHGLSQSVISACDACAIIPMTEGSESLNAAAAAAICIWETVRAK